jgi:hypothetical protein
MRQFVGFVSTRNKTLKFIKQLEKLSATADRLELTLPNGGIVGSFTRNYGF